MTLAMVFAAANFLPAWYSLATRRAQEARARNQALARELEETNRRLQAYSAQLAQSAAVRERLIVRGCPTAAHLGRDAPLHLARI